MRALPLVVLLALSITAYGQEPSQTEPDTSGQRLQQFLRTADELQRAGRQQEAAAARQQAGRELQALQDRMQSLKAEVDNIQRVVGSVPQVIVHLKVYEISLTKLRSIGYDMSKLPGNLAALPDGVSKTAPSRTFSLVDDDGQAAKVFEALRKDNLVKVLAEPTIVAISGSPAQFRSGGDVPIPAPTIESPQKTALQHYGTDVQLLPSVLGNRNIRLELGCQISELDYGNATRLGKEVVPGIRSRDMSTCVQLPSGRTLVIAGLIQSRAEAENYDMPLNRETTNAGAESKSVRVTRNEVATFVLITPEIMEPLDESVPAKSGPTTQATLPTPSQPKTSRR